MKNTNITLKKLTSILLIAAFIISLFSTPTAQAASTLTRIGSKTRTINKGQEIELKVKRPSGVRENDLKWTISDTSILAYADDDRYDDEMEVRGKKAGTTTVTCKNTKNGQKVSFKITVKDPKSDDTISRRGAKERTVSIGQEFELEVKKYNGAKDRNLKWTISDSSIVRFEDDDRYGDDMEFIGRKAGTTKITCKDTVSGDKVTFVITVRK